MAIGTIRESTSESASSIARNPTCRKGTVTEVSSGMRFTAGPMSSRPNTFVRPRRPTRPLASMVMQAGVTALVEKPTTLSRSAPE